MLGGGQWKGAVVWISKIDPEENVPEIVQL